MLNYRIPNIDKSYFLVILNMYLQGILFLEPNVQEQWIYFSFTTLTVRNRYIRGGKCENDVV